MPYQDKKKQAEYMKKYRKKYMPTYMREYRQKQAAERAAYRVLKTRHPDEFSEILRDVVTRAYNIAGVILGTSEPARKKTKRPQKRRGRK
jgi:hypothetical protein